MVDVAVVGAAGYAGIEAVRWLVLGHPRLELALVTSAADAGPRVDDVYPALARRDRSGLRRPRTRHAIAAALQVALLAVPHTAALALAPRCSSAGCRSSTCPPTSGCTTPTSTRSGTRRRTRRPSCSARPSTGCPSSTAAGCRAPARRRARAATRPPAARRRPRSRRACVGRASSSTRSRASRERAARRGRRRTSARSNESVAPYKVGGAPPHARDRAGALASRPVATIGVSSRRISCR